MDAYLKCLYNYATENLLKEPSPHRQEYRALVSEQERIQTAFEATLTEEQKVLWEAFQNASANVLGLEDLLTFEQGVALGKWMILS